MTFIPIAVSRAAAGERRITHLWLLDGRALTMDDAVSLHRTGHRFATREGDPRTELHLASLQHSSLGGGWAYLASRRSVDEWDTLAALPEIPPPGTVEAFEAFAQVRLGRLAAAQGEVAAPGFLGHVSDTVPHSRRSGPLEKI